MSIACPISCPSVFPAQAGMNRVKRLFRESPCKYVFPAQAGMNRFHHHTHLIAGGRVPRTGGDEPAQIAWKPSDGGDEPA